MTYLVTSLNRSANLKIKDYAILITLFNLIKLHNLYYTELASLAYRPANNVTNIPTFRYY